MDESSLEEKKALLTNDRMTSERMMLLLILSTVRIMFSSHQRWQVFILSGSRGKKNIRCFSFLLLLIETFPFLLSLPLFSLRQAFIEISFKFCSDII